MSLLHVESYVFIDVFYLVLFCIHVCVDDVIQKKKKKKKPVSIFFHKVMKFYIAIFSARKSSTSAKHFFSQKCNRNIFTEIYFYGFFLTVWILTGIPLILYLYFYKITYYLSILLPTSHAAFRENFTWC